VYADAGTAKSTRRDNRNCSEVQRLVDLFLKGTDRPERVRVPGDNASDCDPSDDNNVTDALRPNQPLPSATSSFGAADAIVAQVLPVRRYWFSSDPSFVFFRPIPNSDSGPIGALGVPLTAGRSVAVDPRTTPLGAPVFIATTGRSLGDRINRLMVAQDTGGAIRGAVRADYFWGFGPTAGQWASRMNETGRMWLLLPRDLHIATGPATQTRGIAPRGGDAGERECVIADPDLCVE